MQLKVTHKMLLTKIAQDRSLDLRDYSESVRQRAIDLAMCEPPLVEIDADRISLTADGEKQARNIVGMRI